jgi:hypothetical protein
MADAGVDTENEAGVRAKEIEKWVRSRSEK